MDEISAVESRQKKPKLRNEIDANTLVSCVKAHYKSQTHLTNKFSMKLGIENCYTELALVSQKEQEEKERMHRSKSIWRLFP